MRRFQFIAILGLAGALFSGMLAPVTAQQGVVIQNNGVDSTDSARGADNVNISQASGMSSSNNGAGVNNEAGQVVRDKERNRRDRRDDAAGEAAPAETWEEAPAEGDYQAYAPEGEWVESAGAPVDAVASEQTTALDPNLPVQLPNTGMGADDPSNMWVASTLLSLVFGTLYLRSRRVNSLAVKRATTR